MLKTSPFLLFDGNCAEAMTFYHECFGGELSLTKLADTPMKDMIPPEKHNRIINAYLKSGIIEISATDWMAAPQYEPILGEMYAIFVTGNYDEVKSVFDKLAVGAEKDRLQELHQMPFGMYGQMYDKFHRQWIFVANEKNNPSDSKPENKL
jgi:PhnB protein